MYVFFTTVDFIMGNFINVQRESDDVFIILRLLLCVHLAPLHQYTTFTRDVSDYNWFSLLSVSRRECFK